MEQIGSLIEVTNLELRINSRILFSDLSFTIADGEIVALLGANGSGKSSLLRCLIRALAPRSGAIILRGLPLKKYSQRDLAKVLSYIPQSLHGGWSLTAWDFLRASGKWSAGGDPRYKSWLDEVVDESGIRDLLPHRLGSLSGGETQRLLFASALVQQPALVLCDELTHSLDPQYKVDALRRVRSLHHSRNTSFLWVTHDIDEALALASRVLAIREGRLILDECSARLTKQEILSEVFPFQSRARLRAA